MPQSLLGITGMPQSYKLLKAKILSKIGKKKKFIHNKEGKKDHTHLEKN